MSRTSIAVAAALATGAGGFVLGRVTAHAKSVEHATATAPASSREPDATTKPATPPTPPTMPVAKTHAAFTEAMQAAERDASRAEATLPACVQQLRVVRQLVKDDEVRRVESEGTAIPARQTPAAPRFASSSISGALQAAFASTKIPGSVDGVDCAEYPCIVFGRIRGTEGEMPKLEHAKSMAVYEEDILTVLLWSATDVEAKEAAEARHESDEGLEQSLFAIALYPRADEEKLGDNLERRIRSRTAELWNAMSPSDETNAHPPQ